MCGWRGVPAWAMVLSCALAWTQSVAQPRFAFDQVPTTLPKTVLPLRTELVLTLDPAAPTFSGEATIHLRVRERVDAIVLHARELALQSPPVLDGARAVRELRGSDAAEVREAWSLRPTDGRPIAPGRYALRLRYTGKVNTAGDGLFVVPYQGADGPERMLATQFEAIHARRVVPTFDAPLFRQVFQLDVLAPEGQEVFSNTPRTERRGEGALVRHRFAPTPPMASYLLTVAVGRLEWIEDQVDGVALRIVAPKGRARQGTYAMEVTKKLLPFYRGYFGQRYPLPKLDQLAVPGVRYGAQEDWGLISYVESRLLVEAARDTPEVRFSIHTLMAHEIAHQWFGNLVSAASWDDIWLNEAFAEWMMYKATHHFHPEWGSPLRSRMRMEPTLASDATAATRPIRGGLVSEERIADVFDSITYQKGAAVVGMLEQWIGADAFRRGLAAYMKARAYRPATAADLWHHLARASGRPVERVSRFWTEHTGLPVIGVSQACEGGRTQVTLTRRRFALVDGLADQAWPVPVRLAQGQTLRDVLVQAPRQVASWAGCDDRPVVANAGGAGYYRVLPDEALQGRLLDAFASLAPADQLALLSDSFAAVQAGTRGLREHLAVLRALPRAQGDGRESLYSEAIAQWERLAVIFRGTPAEPDLRTVERAFLAPELARLGWAPRAGESAAAGLLRANAIRRLAVLGEPSALEGVNARCAAARANDTAAVPASIRAAVLVGCSRVLDDATYAQMFEAFRSARSRAEQLTLLRGLAGDADEVRARKLLAAAAAGEFPGATAGDLPFFLSGSSRLGPDLYRMTLDHWEPLARAAGDAVLAGKQMLLPLAASAVTDAEGADQLVADQLRLMGEAGRRAAEREAAAVRVRARLKAREAAGLPALLMERAP